MYDFESSSHFLQWKETVAEKSFVYYTKEKEYKPQAGGNAIRLYVTYISTEFL